MTDETLEYNPSQPAGTLLLLHGLGATGADLHPLAPLICGGQLRVVCPTAVRRPITINGGWRMPAWYDIAGADLESRQDEAGIKESATKIEEWLQEEETRMPGGKIFLGGFSQGAAMSVYAGIRHAHKLSGIIVLSGYSLLDGSLKEEAATCNRTTPIFQAHGEYDMVVLPDWARQCHKKLQEGGWNVDYHEYPMAHAIGPETISDLNAWFAKIV